MVFEDGALMLKQLFEGMIACEKKAAQFYDVLSHKFADYEDVAAFWMQMRDDEFHHANTLQILAGEINAEQLSVIIGESVRQKLISVQRLLNEAMDSLVVTLGDAYEMAHRIETSEVNAIFAFLAFEGLPSEDRKYLVKQQVDEHVESLQEFGQRYKSAFAVRAILARDMRRGDG